jgi:two-component system, NtrC family, response regulator HydG
METILVVDDDVTFTQILKVFLSKNGYSVDVAHNVTDAARILDKGTYHLYLFDYRLPDGTGLDIMSAATIKNKKAPTIIMTSFNDVRTSVKAMRLGAFDYIIKPINPDELLMVIKEALRKNESPGTNSNKLDLPDFVKGISPESQKLHDQVKLIASTEMSVIIQGESGTGKEYIARLIHSLSGRGNKPFIAIDCGTLSAELATSELFGHLRGSFTGAMQNKKGKLEEADGGTLFLDEIGNLNYEVQVKLLRVLQERVIQPIGSNKEIKIDVRIVVATNEDLKSGVRNGKFREDLYHRFNEFKIEVPPLRKRISDFPLFVDFFIQESNRVLHRNVKQLSPEVLEIFRNYDWPGNIRELKNIVKRLVLLSTGEIAHKDCLPEEMILDISHPFQPEETDIKAWQENIERELIEKTLREVKYNKSKAAKLLNIDRSTLYVKMEKYGMV